MFQEVYMFAAIAVWVLPVMLIVTAIRYPKDLTKKQWCLLLLVTIVGCTYVTYTNLHDRDLDLVPAGNEFLTCKYISRTLPADSSVEKVELMCGGGKRMLNSLYYDTAVAAAKRHKED